MASPQVEDGYTMIANELLEAISRKLLSGDEHRIFWTILRKTYGFKKRTDQISLSQFVLATGINKQNICRVLSKLIKKNMIIKIDNKSIRSYSIQKDYTTWEPLSKKTTAMGEGRLSINEVKEKIRKRDNNICQLCGYDGNASQELLSVHHIDFNQTNNNDNNLITLCKSCHAKSHTVIQRDNLSKQIKSVIQIDNKSLSKQITTKERDTKETITKEKRIAFDVENYVFLNIKEKDREVWKNAFPGCIIDQELKKMIAWLLGDWPRRKKINYKRFITGWLSRTQDKGGSKTSTTDEMDAWAKRQAEKEKK